MKYVKIFAVKAQRMFGVEIANIPIINARCELGYYRELMRDADFRAKVTRMEPIDLKHLVWKGLPKDLLTYLVQRGILAVEATVNAAVEYQAHSEKPNDATFLEKRDKVWNSGAGSANVYYNRLPQLIDPRYMLCNSDEELWKTTKLFYSEIRNPLFHGDQLYHPSVDSVGQIMDYLEALMQWINSWCVWNRFP